MTSSSQISPKFVTKILKNVTLFVTKIYIEMLQLSY